MSACWGIRKDGLDKFCLVRNKENPEDLGESYLNFIKKNKISFFKNLFNKLDMKYEIAYPDDIEKKILNTYIQYNQRADWGNIIIPYESDFDLYKSGFCYAINAFDKMTELSWMYILDLDNMYYEIRIGKQIFPDFFNRYGTIINGKFYPPKVIARFHLQCLPDNLKGMDQFNYIIDTE